MVFTARRLCNRRGVPSPSAARLKPIARFVERAAASPRWTLGVCVLAVLLTLPSLSGGLWGDDYFQARHFLGLFNGSDAPWWDMFHLQTGDLAKRFGGIAPWWTADELHVQFFRPLTAATHWLDYRLWPARHWLMHLHSVLYFALLVGAVAKLYRMLEADRRVALLASVLFAGAYVHSTSVGWIANRNAVLAALFGVLGLIAYLRWREPDGRWVFAALAIASLAASLLCGEIGISTFAFVVAFEFRHGLRPSARGRLAVAVGLGLLLAWRLGYQAMGFGASASGAYIDPIGNPILFAEHLPYRLAWLIAFVVVPVRAALIDTLPHVARLGLITGLLLAGAVVMHAAWRQRSTHRHWLLAIAGCLLPLAASVPGDRLLSFAVIGVCPLIATFLVELLDTPTRLRALGGSVIVATHLLLSPALLAWGSVDLSHGFRETAQTHPGLDFATDDEMAQRSLVVLWAPGYAFVHEMAAARMAAGRRAPTFTWVLGISEDEPEISAEGCCTVVVRSAGGLGREVFAANYRGPQVPFEAGESVKTLAFEAHVETVNADGFATQVRFVFADRLRSGRMVFIRWHGADFERVDINSLEVEKEI